LGIKEILLKAKNTGILIISGYNNRAIISFCRFAKNDHIDFYIIAKNNDDIILLSEYKKSVIDIRKDEKLSIDDFRKWKQQINKDTAVILPSTEYLNRFILKNRKYLEDNGYIIPLCEENIYNEISDKYSFGRLCEKHGIQIPLECNADLKFPCVAKPKAYSTSTDLILKPELLYSEDSYKTFIENYDANNFYFQEFIGGKSIYLLFYFSTDNKISLFSQENLIQQDHGLSIIAAVSSDYHLRDIASKYTKMLSELKFHGLIMVETKLFNERYYAIEANPRLWGPSQLILDSGMDLFHCFMSDYGLLQPDKMNTDYKKGVMYFWSGGIFQDGKNESNIVFHGGYNQERFIRDYHRLFSSEIYLREDTIGIYRLEHKTAQKHGNLNPVSPPPV
jgi:predicted ATP-grasp superfamily ATP-dependent carboligase